MLVPGSCLLVKTELRRDQWCTPVCVCDDQDYSQGRGHYPNMYLETLTSVHKWVKWRGNTSEKKHERVDV